MREQYEKYYAVAGTKNYRWLESEMVRSLEKEHVIDVAYYEALAEDAKSAIEQYGYFDRFVSDDPDWPLDDDVLPF